jgi:hypothetical protein
VRWNYHQVWLGLHQCSHLLQAALRLLCVAIEQFAGHPELRFTLLQGCHCPGDIPDEEVLFA